MKKLFLLFATAGLLLASCSSEDDNLAPAGTLAPPEWLIGTWGGGGLLNNIIVTEDDFTIGLFSFKDITALANTVSQALGNGTVQVREIRKTDTEYVVGQQTRRTSAAPPSTMESHRFRKGDGTYIEHAEFNTDTRSWGEWQRHDILQ